MRSNTGRISGPPGTRAAGVTLTGLSAGTAFWHGGRPGLPRGSFVLPPSITRVKSLSDYGAAGVHRRDRVYVTTTQAVALMYAAGVPKGVIYQVEPHGEIEPDPDCTLPGLSFQCERARILRCIKPKPADLMASRAVLTTSACAAVGPTPTVER